MPTNVTNGTDTSTLIQYEVTAIIACSILFSCTLLAIFYYRISQGLYPLPCKSINDNVEVTPDSKRKKQAQRNKRLNRNLRKSSNRTKWFEVIKVIAPSATATPTKPSFPPPATRVQASWMNAVSSLQSPVHIEDKYQLEDIQPVTSDNIYKVQDVHSINNRDVHSINNENNNYKSHHEEENCDKTFDEECPVCTIVRRDSVVFTRSEYIVDEADC